MDEYLTLLGTLLGAIIGAAIGAILTYVGAYQIEKQHRKKEMRDRIYGPMFMETSKTLEAVRKVQPIRGFASRGLESLERMSDDSCFLLLEKT